MLFKIQTQLFMYDVRVQHLLIIHQINLSKPQTRYDIIHGHTRPHVWQLHSMANNIIFLLDNNRPERVSENKTRHCNAYVRPSKAYTTATHG